MVFIIQVDPVKGVRLARWNGKYRLPSQGDGRIHCSCVASGASPLSLHGVSHLLGKDQGGRLLPPLQLGDEQEPIILRACSEMHLKLIMLARRWEALPTATVMKASEGPGYPQGGQQCAQGS